MADTNDPKGTRPGARPATPPFRGPGSTPRQPLTPPAGTGRQGVAPFVPPAGARPRPSGPFVPPRVEAAPATVAEDAGAGVADPGASADADSLPSIDSFAMTTEEAPAAEPYESEAERSLADHGGEALVESSIYGGFAGAAPQSGVSEPAEPPVPDDRWETASGTFAESPEALSSLARDDGEERPAVDPAADSEFALPATIAEPEQEGAAPGDWPAETLGTADEARTFESAADVAGPGAEQAAEPDAFGWDSEPTAEKVGLYDDAAPETVEPPSPADPDPAIGAMPAGIELPPSAAALQDTSTFEAVFTPPAAEPAFEGGTSSGPVSEAASRERAAEALETIAWRLRAGDVTIHPLPEAAGEAAVVAAVLAALLGAGPERGA